MLKEAKKALEIALNRQDAPVNFTHSKEGLKTHFKTLNATDLIRIGHFVETNPQFQHLMRRSGTGMTLVTATRRLTEDIEEVEKLISSAVKDGPAVIKVRGYGVSTLVYDPNFNTYKVLGPREPYKTSGEPILEKVTAAYLTQWLAAVILPQES